MGLFSSRSSSSKTTNNYDNRVVNDYAGAELDFSQIDDNSIDGNANNNSGTINFVDAGSLQAIQSAAASNERVTKAALDTSALNFESLNNSFADSAATLLKTADNLGMYTIDAAMSAHDNALLSQQLGNELVIALNDTAAKQAADTNDALTSGFEQSMQFVEHFSRSDGADIVKNNTKMIAIIAAAAVVAAFILRGS